MRRGLDATALLLASLAGGFLVGAWDGISAGRTVGVGAAGTLAAGGLAAAVDLLLGFLLALVVVIIAALHRWGGRAELPPRARHIAWLLLGGGAAFVTALAIARTAQRNNRFLAAGLVALTALVLALIAALLAPALARLLAPLVRRLPLGLRRPFIRRGLHAIGERITARAERFRARTGKAPAPVRARGNRRRAADPDDEEPTENTALATNTPPPARTGRPTAAGLLLLAPLCALAGAALVFVIVWRTRAPLSFGVRTVRSLLAGAVVLALPPALSWAVLKLRRLSWKIALPITLALLLPGAVFLVRENWIKHLQFVPWRDLRVLGLVILAGAALTPLVLRYLPRGKRRLLPILLAPPAALALALGTGAAEKARKATTTAGGVVGPLLTIVRPALDFDRDGYPGLLGGGDCDEENPKVNPAAQDWPEDGIDQDCDGRDLRAADLRAPPLHPVPARIPRDLNVLLVVIDTLRADRVGAYGYQRPTTPELDRLARGGVVFENAWAHAPSTRYSMPAIVTGRWPSAITWDNSIWWPGIARGQRTIAEVMRAAGYFNGAYYAYGYFNRGDARGFERGIDQYDDRLAAKHVNVGGPAESIGSSAREMADDGIDFLRAYRDQKFFLTLHFYDPHLAYEPHPEAPQFGRTQSDLYDGEVWFTDRHVGRVFAALQQLGLHDKTAIIVTGDHGEGFGEHGVVAHGYHLYAPQTKVPLIVRVPGVEPRRVRAPVGHVDIAPTIVNLARAPQEPTFLGRSMLDLIAGETGAAPAPESVFQEVSFEPLGPGSSSTERRGLATATHHLIWNMVPENTLACFDLVADPGETRDVWGLPAGEAACPPLKRELDRRLSLLKLAELPHDFAARLEHGVSPPRAPAAPPGTAREASFGDRVRFKGFDVRVVGAPFPSIGPPPNAPEPGTPGPSGTDVVRIARGGEVEVVSHFEVKGDLTGWRIFFHLDGPGGTWRNLDHTPVGGAYPVERWRPGQTIRDRFTIRFGATEAPGLHTLAIGFWRPPSAARQRLPVLPRELQDGEHRLRVVTFLVE